MASTEQVAYPLPVVGQNFAGAICFRWGIATLSTGTVNVDTGLGKCFGMICTGVSGADTEGVVLTIMEDLPCAGSAVTVDGTKVDEGAAVANAASQQFCWLAWGTL
jgi:hypothetical protein